MQILCLLLIIIFCVSSQACRERTDCSGCLSVSECVWCTTNTTAFCIQSNDTSNCSSVVNPGSTVSNVDNQPFDQATQISLESIRLKLRVGKPLTFNFSVKAAENFPLDLYIIMDLSRTYKDDLEQVKKLAPQLADSLNNLTNDALIGFGTFVDKLTPPFESQKQIDLQFVDKNGNPSCRKDDPCSLPVAFEHVSDLTNSSTDFNATLQEVIISTSADGPEGTLDAMMQAAVCTDLIGWRDNSRKVLMVMTDDLVHTAGDGRIAGVVKRNDETCHTQYSEQYDRFIYTASTEYDYPSLEQLRLVLRRNGIVPVFAVPINQKKYFEIVSDLLNGFVAVSNEVDSSDLLNVVAEAYSDVVSQVSLDYDLPAFLKTSVLLNCPSGNTSNEICTDIGNNEVQISMTVTLTQCAPEISQGNEYPLVITIPGFDRVTVYLEGECSCDCDSMVENDTSKCVNGDLVCGRCYCNEGWTGDNCNCSTEPCPSFNGLECGGRGTCDGCGSCVCNTISSSQNGVDSPLIYGDACQCSNFGCETDVGGNVCSGRGKCDCDEGVFTCNCSVSSLTNEANYGDVCQCSYDHCVNPVNTASGVCSGEGTCRPCEPQGSACSCFDDYIGNYCETFIDSSVDNCGSVDESCVECFGEAAEEGQDAEGACNIIRCEDYIALDSVQSSSYEIPGTVNGSTEECSISTTECTYVYFVATTRSSPRLVYAVEPRTCLLLPIWAIAVIIIVGLLIIGIVVIVAIKLFIMWLDYREYKRFMYDVHTADKTLQSNPVYQDPITHVDNPVHHGKDSATDSKTESKTDDNIDKISL